MTAHATDADVNDRSGWLTRKEVATRLGLSVSSVRRLEATELHPEKDALGAWRFDPAKVEAYRVQRHTSDPSASAIVHAAPAGPPRLDGAIAAAIFADLADGRSPVDIVIERELDPALVGLAVEHHARLQRAALEAPCGAERLDEIGAELTSLRELMLEVWRALLQLNANCEALALRPPIAGPFR